MAGTRKKSKKNSGTVNTCKKCGLELDIHYGAWCPNCDKPEDKNYRILDFFRVAKYIAQHEKYDYSNSNSNNWYRTVLRQLEFPCNDCYISHYVDLERDEVVSEQMWQFNKGLKKYFGVPERCLLNISW